MGLAIPAGGCFVATSTLLFQAAGFDPHALGWMYPIVMLAVALLMVSEVHYPDFKGQGEKVYLVSKIAFVVIFAGILYVGRASLPFAVLFAIFATYTAFGIINTVVSKLAGK
jgi:CDP-diacylglycerol--serine O-phosphatidyltransferase